MTPGDKLLIDGFHELPYDERDALYPLDLLLCSHQLALETPGRLEYDCHESAYRVNAPLLIFDVFLLKVDVPAECERLFRS